jgi:hypothetical protein
MNPHDTDGLSEAELAAFAALPRERDPGRLLEERTVRALRESGVLRPAQPARGRLIRFPAAWMSGAIAAGLALFMGGLATGQYLAGRNTSELVRTVQQQDAQQAAQMVQQTGSAYVQALARLSQVSDTTRAGQTQGREVASQLLRAAANEVVRLNPNDPVASGILAAFDRDNTRQARAQRDTAASQRVVWF